MGVRRQLRPPLTKMFKTEWQWLTSRPLLKSSEKCWASSVQAQILSASSLKILSASSLKQ
jgi:hypothetical protein